jgi:hypothetical protein
LQYLGSQRLLEGIQDKLMLKLLEFNFSIEYKKGVDNTAVDALSKQFQDSTSDTCSPLSVLVPAWLTNVEASYASDEHCLKLLQELALNNDSHPNFTLESGILRYEGRIYIGSTTNLEASSSIPSTPHY